MNTIYINSGTRSVSLDVPVAPVGGVVDVTVTEQGTLVHTVTTVSINQTTGIISFTLPFALVQSDKQLEVHWVFNYVEDAQTYEYDNYARVNIVTPILPFADIAVILDDFTQEQMETVERAVRYIIQAHTGQFFGKFIGKHWVTGSGEPALRLPSRLLTLTSINSNTYWNDALALRGNGWYLQNKSYGVPTVRADFDGWNESASSYSNYHPIVAPYSRNQHVFIDNAEYEIDGTWGWISVPSAVEEAAKLLINDYACGDIAYRDRFISSMSAADWKLAFHEAAYSNTGNARANILLSNFVLKRGWTVI